MLHTLDSCAPWVTCHAPDPYTSYFTHWWLLYSVHCALLTPVIHAIMHPRLPHFVWNTPVIPALHALCIPVPLPSMYYTPLNPVLCALHTSAACPLCGTCCWFLCLSVTYSRSLYFCTSDPFILSYALLLTPVPCIKSSWPMQSVWYALLTQAQVFFFS